MTKTVTFRKIGVVGARGTKTQIQALRTKSGVEYVEAGAQPIRFFQDTSNKATRGYEATQTVTGADGSKLTGKGVSVAVIDSGVDPTHPYLKESGGGSAVVANLKTLCDPTESLCTVQKVPNSVDTDTLSVGGHGTHVNGIVAGRPTTLTSGEKLQGAAPGAKLVSLSTGAGHRHPRRRRGPELGPGEPQGTVRCRRRRPPPARRSRSPTTPTAPPAAVRSTPNSATVKLQRALAAEGVVTVWANGNDGGDGSASLSNPPGMDPTGGIISAASYNDLDNGTRDGKVSEFSSRGKAGDQSTYPDISAPGENITSSCRLYLVICSTGLDPRNGPGPLDIGTFNTISGTSMAAPHIAGIAAQLFQANPSATPTQVENAMKTTAYKYADGAAYESGPLGTTSFDKGYGLVDVVAAAAAVR